MPRANVQFIGEIIEYQKTALLPGANVLPFPITNPVEYLDLRVLTGDPDSAAEQTGTRLHPMALIPVSQRTEIEALSQER